MRSGKFKILICFAVVLTMLFAMATPAMAATNPDAWKNNGVDLDKLTATDAGLVISGNSVSNPNPQGFTSNFVYLTKNDLDYIYNNATSTKSALGATECYVNTPVKYSTYEHHTQYSWGFWKITGLDVKQIAKNMGVNTDQVLDVEANSSDGFSTTLKDAFNKNTKRYCFNTDGSQGSEVTPMIGMYTKCNELAEDKQDLPSASNPGSWPDDPAGTDKQAPPVFVFGHDSLTTINHCYWAKLLTNVHIGDDKYVLKINYPDGMYATKGISQIISMGIYSTDYSYYSSGINTINSHHVTGIPLSKFLSKVGVKVDSSIKIKPVCSDGFSISGIRSGDLDKWFLAWNATDNNNGGAQIKNDTDAKYSTALRLYGPGQFGNTAVIRDVSEINIIQLVSKITLDKTTLTLANGKTGKLTPTIANSTATNKAVQWSSSNTKVATVNAAGTVTATGIGSAVITCAANDGSGVTANCKVTVKSRSIRLSKTNPAVLSGKKVKLSAALTNGKGAPKKTTLCWKSSNAKVAKVDAKGNVQGVAKGKATITCYAKDDKTVLATCTVTVSQAVTGIKLSASQKTVSKGKTLAIKTKITPSSAANKKVIWKTSSAKIARVNANGVVTGVAKGSVTVTCTAADGSGVKATIKITIK